MNDKAFFDAVRVRFPPALAHPSQVAGFNTLLAAYVSFKWTDFRWFAYLLATTWHETDYTMQPVREAFWETEVWREKHFRYWPWYGRGFCQLTWKGNYALADSALGLGGSLLKDPDEALHLDIAAKVIFRGMSEGWFTGRKLSDFIYGTTCDYRNSRRIINGLDKALTIAHYATGFEACLRAAQ